MIHAKWAPMERLRPSQLGDFITHCPIVYVPAGIYEWHEALNPMGTDTLKMQEIAQRTARLTGGVVHMPLFTGVGAFYGPKEGLPHGGINFDEAFVKEYVLRLCGQLDELGFRLIVLLYGHTNEGNINAYEAAAREHMGAARVLALNDVNPAIRHRYKCRDHAAKWETSFMMASCPEAVCFGEVAPDHGQWWGLNPLLHASAAEGERMYALIAGETARLVEAAMALPREEIGALNFAHRAGAGGPPCWTDCRNIDDLKTDYWKGDPLWEDPCCPLCAWRTPGVTRELARLKGPAWMDALAAHWEGLRCEYRYKTGDSYGELLREWDEYKRTGGQ